MLLKAALLGEEDDHLPGISARELQQIMRDNGVEDKQVEALLNQYEQWLYAEGKPSAAQQRAWLKQVKKAAKPYWQR